MGWKQVEVCLKSNIHPRICQFSCHSMRKGEKGSFGTFSKNCAGMRRARSNSCRLLALCGPLSPELGSAALGGTEEWMKKSPNIHNFKSPKYIGRVPTIYHFLMCALVLRHSSGQQFVLQIHIEIGFVNGIGWKELGSEREVRWSF